MSSIDATALREALNPATVAKMARFDAFPVVDSTNTWLMAQPAPQTGMHRVAIADHQTEGRGRGDKHWLSAPGSSLCLSLAYTFREAPDTMSALTLAVGVAAVHALGDAGAGDVKLKWPNDIVAGDGKLGGMLAESHHRSEVGTSVVVGIGINLELPRQILARVDSDWAQSPVDLVGILGRRVSREELAAKMIDHIVDTLSVYEEHGFEVFAETWRRYDWLRGRVVTVQQPDRSLSGTAAGIDSEGALLVKRGADTVRVISGSIRAEGNGAAAS